MILGKRIQRALEHLHQSKSTEEANIEPPIPLEKGDLPAMIISAMIVILPIALLALVIMAGVGWLWIK